MLSTKKNSKYTQGVFIPKNIDKFIGSKAFYRSSLELRFMKFCDVNENVLKWGSENVIIPYINPLDNKMHRYFVDNFVMIKEGNITKKISGRDKAFKSIKPTKNKIS